jgi:hypothetical protein
MESLPFATIQTATTIPRPERMLYFIIQRVIVMLQLAQTLLFKNTTPLIMLLLGIQLYIIKMGDTSDNTAVGSKAYSVTL